MAQPEQLNRGATRMPMKIFISVSCFAITFLATTAFEWVKQDPNVAIGIAAALFVAGVAFIVQFLYEVERRLATMEAEYSRHSQANEERINEGFHKINDATKLFSLVEESALKTDAITQLVSNSVQIKSNPPLIFDLAQSEINRLSDMLKTLGDAGDLTYEGEDRDWILGLTRHVTSTLDATSTTLDMGGPEYFVGGLWQSDLGQRYLEAQRDAIKRGVRIRRIFILDRPEIRQDPNFLRVAQFHSDIEIEVRALDPTLVPGQFIPPIFDLVIFDGVVCYQATPTTWVSDLSRTNIANTQLITTLPKVAKNVDRFNDLWLVATPVTD